MRTQIIRIGLRVYHRGHPEYGAGEVVDIKPRDRPVTVPCYFKVRWETAPYPATRYHTASELLKNPAGTRDYKVRPRG